jgi:hypothetical protein
VSGIFLSYRREDASGWAGRLYEHLVRDWGPDHVFIDIDNIAPGEDFRKAIARTMETCDVVMVVIGPSWVDVRDAAGRRRLDQEGDTHRAEVVAALSADVRVIPVLVGGATMPEPSDLPGPMQDLAYRNAAIVEDRRFASDVDALQHTLRALTGSEVSPARLDDAEPGGRRTEPAPPPRAPARAPGPTSLGPTSAVVLALLGTGLVLIWGVLDPRDWHNEFWQVRVLAGVLLVVGVAAGLWSRRWTWVLAAGAAGLVGLVLWMLQLLSTHGDEVAELVTASGEGDGFANLATFAGAVLVLVAGAIGVRDERSGSGARSPARR